MAARSGMSPPKRYQCEYTYFYKVEHARPETVVWALSPTALVHDCPLISAATNKVRDDGDQRTTGRC